MTAALLAIAAGATYALASVVQQHAAHRQPDELSMHPRLLLRLLREPLWLLGIAIDSAAFVLEACALGLGSVNLVAPLLVTGLVFLLPLSALINGSRATARDGWAIIALTAALVVFVAVGQPGGGSSAGGATAWFVAIAAVGALVAIGLRAARRVVGSPRALVLGITTGVAYGLTAVLTKTVVDQLDRGVLAPVGHWELYALAAFSAVALLTNQSAFQAGPVTAALPAISVVSPVAACVLGAALFGEHLGVHTPAGWAVTLLAIAAMILGTAVLAGTSGRRRSGATVIPSSPAQSRHRAARRS